jgi:hypothetical protein
MDKLNTFEEFKTYIDSLSPMDVERFVYDLFIELDIFSEIKLNSIINNRQIDITLSEKNTNPITKSPIKNRAFWAVEIKSYRSSVPISVIDSFYGKLSDIQEDELNARLLIISTNGFTKAAIDKAGRTGIYLWGASELYDLYVKNPIEMSIPVPPKEVELSDLTKKADAFKKALIGTESGRDTWSQYQSLIADILEFLLCPPLEAPKVELADSDKRNRRDIIFENSSMNGFWPVVRDIYKGHYIVVDAKNYSSWLNKKPILDISHYLKPYGCGMFSIVVSRKGYGPAAVHAAKEQWIGGNKMIVSLSDQDILKMLEFKKEGIAPEEVIKQYISEFRMSL